MLNRKAVEDLREEADSREKGCLGRRKTKIIRAQTLLRRRDGETAYTVCGSLTGPGVPITAPGRRRLVQLLPFQTVLRWALNMRTGSRALAPQPQASRPSHVAAGPAVRTQDRTRGPLRPAQPALAPGQPLPVMSPTTCRPSHTPEPCDPRLLEPPTCCVGPGLTEHKSLAGKFWNPEPGCG